nr:protein NRT1/ PTR FAMILY 5.6-like [Coffea arabica]
MGLLLLTMSSTIPALKPSDNIGICLSPRKVHEVIFFLGIYLISIATGGHKPSLESFGADQFDGNHPAERRHKMSFFNWWNFGLCCGLLLAVTLIVYVQEHVSWGMADIILTVVMASTIVIFCVGKPFYRYRQPSGSPFTPMLQVIVATISKRKLPYPSNAGDLYEVSTAISDCLSEMPSTLALLISLFLFVSWLLLLLLTSSSSPPSYHLKYLHFEQQKYNLCGFFSLERCLHCGLAIAIAISVFNSESCW